MIDNPRRRAQLIEALRHIAFVKWKSVAMSTLPMPKGATRKEKVGELVARAAKAVVSRHSSRPDLRKRVLRC